MPLHITVYSNSSHSTVPTRFTFHVYPFTVLSLPARSQDRLHVLRPLIDRLIPREASLCSEPRHRLNQLIDLRAEDRLSVPSLDGLGAIRRTAVPILNRHAIG